MRARRWLLACAFALSVPALALAITLVAASAQESPPPTPGGSASPAATGSSPAPGSTPSVTGSGKSLPGDPTKGQTLFGQNCASCHGADLTGGVGPRLNPIANLGNTKNPLDPNYLIGVITNGLSGYNCSAFNCSSQAMPAKGGNAQLTSQDVADLASFIIQSNRTPGQPALDPHQLAIENVKWVTIGIVVMLIITWMLARYNMRWIDRRAAARRERIARQGRG